MSDRKMIVTASESTRIQVAAESTQAATAAQ